MLKKIIAARPIQILSSADQELRYQRSVIGLDTEMLLSTGKGKVLWPHEEGFPQERDPKNPITTDDAMHFDWHGDGFAFEFNPKPRTCIDELSTMVSKGLRFMTQRSGGALKIEAPSVYHIPREVVENAPDRVKQLGCSPSRNVYEDFGRPGSLSPTQRTTGCHLHISHPELRNSADLATNLVYWADALVGVVWTYISPEDPKLEAARRKAYGRAGEHRLQTYPSYPQGEHGLEYSKGVEYRVLPGLAFSHPAYLTLMFNLYRGALRMAYDHGAPSSALMDASRKAINKADRETAQTVLKALPLDEPGKAFIDFLSHKPLKALNTREWSDLTAQTPVRGHRHMAANVPAVAKLIN